MLPINKYALNYPFLSAAVGGRADGFVQSVFPVGNSDSGGYFNKFKACLLRFKFSQGFSSES